MTAGLFRVKRCCSGRSAIAYAVQEIDVTAKVVTHLDTADWRLRKGGVDLAFVPSSDQLVAHRGSTLVEQRGRLDPAGVIVAEWPAGAGGDGHRRPVRAVGGLVVRDRDAGKEPSQRRHRTRLARQGRLGDLLAPLDAAGNSVRGQLVTKHLAERLGLNRFASEPAGALTASPMS